MKPVLIPTTAPTWHAEILQAAADGRITSHDALHDILLRHVNGSTDAVDDKTKEESMDTIMRRYFDTKNNDETTEDKPGCCLLYQHCLHDVIRCASGCTILHWAAGNGHRASIDYMLQQKQEHFNVDVRAIGISQGRTPLHYACRNGHLDIVRLLIENYGANPNAMAKHNITPFQMAVHHGRIDVAQYLVYCANVDPYQVNDFDCGAIHWVGLAPPGRRLAVLPMARWLHESLGLSMDVPQRQLHTALHKAAWGGHLPLCRYLHQQLNMWDIQRDVVGYTAAGLALLAGHHQVASYLRKYASLEALEAWKVLGIAREILPFLDEESLDRLQTIQRAYRTAVRQCHPDLKERRRVKQLQQTTGSLIFDLEQFEMRESSCVDKFQAITLAYQFLTTPECDILLLDSPSQRQQLPLLLQLPDQSIGDTIPTIMATDRFEARLRVLLDEYRNTGLDLSNLKKKWNQVWPEVAFPYNRQNSGGRSLKQWLKRMVPQVISLRSDAQTNTLRVFPRR